MTYYLNLNNYYIAYNSPELLLISKFVNNFNNSNDKNKCIETYQLFHLFK